VLNELVHSRLWFNWHLFHGCRLRSCSLCCRGFGHTWLHLSSYWHAIPPQPVQ